MAKTWKVVTSPRARFVLAGLLLNRKLVFKTRKQDRELHTAREALGLIGVTETLLEYKRVNEAYAADSKTLHVFEMSQESADFLIECREKVEVNGYDSLALADLFMQLENQHHEENEGLDYMVGMVRFDEATELLRWKPSYLPVLEGPDKFYDVLRTMLERWLTFPAFRSGMLLALEPLDADPDRNGQDTAEVQP